MQVNGETQRMYKGNTNGNQGIIKETQGTMKIYKGDTKEMQRNYKKNYKRRLKVNSRKIKEDQGISRKYSGNMKQI